MNHSTYFLDFIQCDLVHSTVNNSVVLLPFIESFSWYGVAPEVLSRLGFSILGHKFPKELTFIGRMSKDVDETGF